MGITRKEALDYFVSNDLIGIGMEADAIRRSLHPEGVVSYSLDGMIDTGDVSNDAGFKRIADSISEILALGGAAITLQGGSLATQSPVQDLGQLEALFGALKQRFPNLWLHCLSATEILALSRRSSLSLEDTLGRLRDFGLDSIPGNDAGILDDAVHLDAPARCRAEDWITVHRAAHKLGIETTAAMIFGAGETFEHRLNHLEALRQLQQETGGFASFTPWTLATRNATAPGFEEATAVEYLKTLAISRMVLDNILNVQCHLESQGLKVLQVSLRFGANDAGSVLHAHGANAASEEQLRQVIRDAGFKPVQRDTVYRIMLLA